MTEQMAIERNAAELEMAEELMGAKKDAAWWKEAFYQAVRREKNVTKRLYGALGYHESDELRNMEILMREHLDESSIEDDDEWESQARQILWNDSDAEKEIAVEECVPF